MNQKKKKEHWIELFTLLIIKRESKKNYLPAYICRFHMYSKAGLSHTAFKTIHVFVTSSWGGKFVGIKGWPKKSANFDPPRKLMILQYLWI